MGSGATRAFWREQGPRSKRRFETKTAKPTPSAAKARLRIKALRAEAKRIANEGR